MILWIGASDTFLAAATSAMCSAYEGVQASASGCSRSTAASSLSVLPTPTGMCTVPIASNAASDAPATNGPAP